MGEVRRDVRTEAVWNGSHSQDPATSGPSKLTQESQGSWVGSTSNSAWATSGKSRLLIMSEKNRKRMAVSLKRDAMSCLRV